MSREVKRRRFDEGPREAYVADGLACNWTIHRKHFDDYTPILDFVHAVSYLFTASIACLGKTEAAWSAYCGWMRSTWQGDIDGVRGGLRRHQERIGLPSRDVSEDDSREQLRQAVTRLALADRR